MGSVPVLASPRRRRRRRGWLIALLVLAILLVAADRLGNAVAENQAAKTLQTSQHLADAPSVDIGGFPFLTQLAAGTFGEVTITATGVPIGNADRTLRVAAVTVHLHNVHIARDLSSVRAETATADAVVNYADLSRTLGVQMGFGGASADGVGRVEATASTTVAGRQVSGTVSAEVRASNTEGLSFVDQQVAVDGLSVPGAVTATLAGVFGAPIPLSHLPFGVNVLRVAADESGVTIRLSGRNLVFHRG